MTHELNKRVHNEDISFYYVNGRIVCTITFDGTEAKWHHNTLPTKLPRPEDDRFTSVEAAEQAIIDGLKSIGVEISGITLIEKTPVVKYGTHWLDAEETLYP